MAPQDGRRREDKKMGKNEQKPLTGEERTNTILSARLGSARLGSARLGSARLGSARLGRTLLCDIQGAGCALFEVSETEYNKDG